MEHIETDVRLRLGIASAEPDWSEKQLHVQWVKEGNPSVARYMARYLAKNAPLPRMSPRAMALSSRGPPGTLTCLDDAKANLRDAAKPYLRKPTVSECMSRGLPASTPKPHKGASARWRHPWAVANAVTYGLSGPRASAPSEPRRAGRPPPQHDPSVRVTGEAASDARSSSWWGALTGSEAGRSGAEVAI